MELEATYGAGACFFTVDTSSAVGEAGVHHRVESISRQGTGGTDTQVSQRCLGEGAQHGLTRDKFQVRT